MIQRAGLSNLGRGEQRSLAMLLPQGVEASRKPPLALGLLHLALVEQHQQKKQTERDGRGGPRSPDFRSGPRHAAGPARSQALQVQMSLSS